MRSVVRNIVRNQHEENMPEANREVIDHIISKACREVDAMRHALDMGGAAG